MATSKINQADAQEMLESLQQIGEGWWRQANLALNMGAHRALGMEPREFVLTIGRQQTLDAKDAVLEMFRSGTSMSRIATIVGMSALKVQMILAEEGLIEITPKVQRMLDTGKTEPDRTDNRTARIGSAGETSSRDEVIDAEVVEDDADTLYAEIEALDAKVKGEQAKRRREVKDLKEQISGYQRQLVNAEREAQRKAEAALTSQERKRLAKEAEAWAQEHGEEVMAGLTAGMASLIMGQITESLEAASEGVRHLTTQLGGITGEQLQEIERAHAVFIEELNVARMSERSA